MLVADFELARREFAVRITLRVTPGERVALLGRSGAGKTTTLEALAGLLRLNRGEIRLGERLLSSATSPAADVAVGRRGIGLLRQNPGLFPHLTVLENIGYASGVDQAVARVAGERLGLGGLLEARPRGLSGGEAQRVALARALQTKVGLLCLDEPFNSLDRPLGMELLELTRRELAASGTAALLVTHQLQEAQAFADRVAVLDRGSVLQVGDPRELVLRPKTALVASLVGYRGWLRRGGQLRAIHPDRVHLSSAADGAEVISGRVVGMRPDGARIDVEMEAEGEWVGRFHWPAIEPPQPGARLHFQADDAPIFTGPGAVFD